MSGLELDAGIIAVLDLLAKVTKLCFQYSSELKNAQDDISRLQTESTKLHRTLEQVRQLLASPNGDTLRACQDLRDAIEGCIPKLEDLDELLDPGKGLKAMSSLGLRAFKWPLKKRKRNAIELAVNVDQTSLVLNLERRMDDMRLAISGSMSPSIPRSILPFEVDPDFVSRPDILAWMEDKFQEPASRVALVGLGGVGKSQIAIHFAHQIHKSQPDTRVFWVYASSKARFEEGYRSIAHMLRLPGLTDPNVNVLSLVRDWLHNEQNGNWLMILDNADDISVLYPTLVTREQRGSNTANDSASDTPPLAMFLPRSRNGRILITSRSMNAAEWLTETHKNTFKVPVMSQDQAAELFQKRLPDSVWDESTAELLSALDFLPLAISQATAYITRANRRTPRLTARAYLDEFRKSEEKSRNLLNKDAGGFRRDESASNAIVTTLQITFEQIRRERPSAANLLSFMSFFSPQGIPEFVLQAYDEYDNLDEDLDVLCGYSLVSVAQKETCEMHSLVQLSIRAWLSSSRQSSSWKRTFLRVIAREFPSGDFETWHICQILYPHVQSIVLEKPADEEDLIDWASLLTGVARYMEAIGNYIAGEAMARKAVASRKEVLGKQHPDTLASMRNLASVLRKQGKYDEAEQMHREGLLLQVWGRRHVTAAGPPL